jgi:hypothetical protein
MGAADAADAAKLSCRSALLLLRYFSIPLNYSLLSKACCKVIPWPALT